MGEWGRWRGCRGSWSARWASCSSWGVALAVSCLARLAGVPALRIRRVLMVVGVLWFALYALALVAGFMFAAWLWGSNWAF